ncbi:MAG: tetratricopeptide repeat protein [Kiritimatiellae bacterium]|nr:tetratricopeptide repeat protein [Kiritimatiellia bacterium]MDD5519447.1 tetratricopeptide repeat protein [Kiritimatiellia bacterium]
MKYLAIVVSLVLAFPLHGISETNNISLHAIMSVDAIKAKAEAGDVQFQIWLGDIYSMGKKVPQNYTEAAKWYLKAAEQGNASAQCHLGVMYCSGNGMKRNYEEAYKWFQKGADQNDEAAQLNLSKMYIDGVGVRQNYIEAYKWLILVTTKGFPPAIKSRDDLLKKMTPEQIAEGQKLAKEWKPKMERKLK